MLKDAVYGLFDFFENVVRWEHGTVGSGTVNPLETRIHLTLAEIHVTDPHLETDVGLMDVLAAAQIIPVTPLPLGRKLLLDKPDRHIQEDVQVRAGQVECTEFRIDDPFAKCLTLLRPFHLGTLVGDVGINVPVQQKRPSGSQAFPHLRGGAMPVLGIQQRHQLRMDRIQGTETATQEFSDQFAVDRGVIAREMDVLQRSQTLFQILFEPADLGRFSLSVQAFYDKQHDVYLPFDYKDSQKTKQSLTIICIFDPGFMNNPIKHSLMKKVMYVAMALCMMVAVSCKNGNKNTPKPVDGEGVDEAIEAVEDAAAKAGESVQEAGGAARDLALEALDEIKGTAEEAAAKALAEAAGAISFAAVEEKPTFNGGDANDFSKWVNQNITYPEIAKEKGVEGRVVLGFVVDENGEVKNVKVLKGVDPALDAEAVRVVSNSPKWAAGKQNGQAAKVSYTFPVLFKLN